MARSHDDPAARGRADAEAFLKTYRGPARRCKICRLGGPRIVEFVAALVARRKTNAIVMTDSNLVDLLLERYEFEIDIRTLKSHLRKCS